MKIRYSTKEHPFLCFKHAVQLAMKDEDVESEADEDADSEYDMRQSWCSVCYPK